MTQYFVSSIVSYRHLYFIFHVVSYLHSASGYFHSTASTAFHAQELGFRTILVDDCSRGIKSEDIEKTKDKIKENNGCVIHSSEVRLTINAIGSFSLDAALYGIKRNETEKLFNENNILGKIDGPGKRSKSRVGVSTCIRM